MGMQHQWHHYNHWYGSKTTKYHGDSRMDALVTFIITTVGLGMLIGPLWLLKAFNHKTADHIRVSRRLFRSFEHSNGSTTV
jgi:hypothetical protein